MLREKTQRRLFRLLFVLGCLLPTLAIAGWAFTRFHPAFKEMVLAEVSRQAGVIVDCESFKTPRPGVYQVIGLEVLDPYTQQLLGRADRLTAQKIDDAWQLSIGDAWIENPSKGGNKEFRLADIPVGISSTFESLTIGKADRSLVSWNRVKIDFQPDTDGADTDGADTESGDTKSTAKLIFVSHKASGEPDTQITLSQSYAKDQLVTKLNLDTGSTPLAGELIPLEESLAALSVESTFVGTCDATQTGDLSEGAIRGMIQLSQGDLGNRYGSWQQAKINMQDLKWKGTMATRFKGELDIRSGAIGRQMVSGLITRLKCGNSETLDKLWDDNPKQAIPYDQLACELEFDWRGLILVGKCRNLEGKATNGTLAYSLLARNNESLLKQPEEKLIPLWSILQAFWPNSPAYVPVSSEAQKLARLLPFATETVSAE